MIKKETDNGFQHAAARRRLDVPVRKPPYGSHRFNTQPPEGGWAVKEVYDPNLDVSTRSRPKAAGPENARTQIRPEKRFNTQPPEGGWVRKAI